LSLKHFEHKVTAIGLFCATHNDFNFENISA